MRKKLIAIEKRSGILQATDYQFVPYYFRGLAQAQTTKSQA
jgi:hypothetical protein